MYLLLYNLGLLLYSLALRMAAPFNPKARKFITGRQAIFSKAAAALAGEKRERIWMHCASLGEFEQGRPLLEQIRAAHPEVCIILTFFSPSGYEVQKNYAGADHVFYLPLDHAAHARRFIAILQPACALFVKYEFWYHYLKTLSRKGIPTILFSAIFQERHPFFKWYGSLYRSMLACYDRIFVQDEASLSLLAGIGIKTAAIAGDTRFDRAAKILETPRTYSQVAALKGDSRLIVAGSTWTEDEQLLQQALSQLPAGYKLLIVPHEVDPGHITAIRSLFGHIAGLWEDPDIAEKSVGIVNSVGQLSYLYRYADVVWVGGGFTKSGIHNIIEPAVYGLPVLFGPNYSRYREAVDMIARQAAQSTANAAGLIACMYDEQRLTALGAHARQYVQEQLGATATIMAYLEERYCFTRERKL
ncbi:3-deoxy-D-manno-octulosonic acid transferase [Taibaiella chishuiensis]|uniref:3-deoxy-D-manno-octulosonic acid transferase n=1 Tax=Taibaiella chishuiensis TaxID=1434707 RepID=A0A2P8DBI4_9BACT|nr:glycosyltransferase N-terminal domain-containing protein [Taibaiella chishuiensis]PSK94572.1 3-deoxy-D-manno-octulosonic-acid transferase [Taibaiella chishuiensis]